MFFLKGVQEQAQDTTRRIKKLQDLQAEWRSRLGAAHANANTVWLLEYLFENPVITIPQSQKLLKVKSYHTAQQIVEKLLALDILHPLGDEAYDRRFYAKDILLTIAKDKQE